MAEISQSGTPNAHGKVRVVKQSIRIDMTPMVDLAFLLLTFFILTTTFSDAYVLQLPMPDKDGPQSTLSEKNALNVVVAGGNKLFWWEGIQGKVAETNYSRAGLRQILLDRGAKNQNLMVLIKPMDNSKYENIVDVLDEITITNTQRYAIVDFTDEDQNMIPSHGSPDK